MYNKTKQLDSFVHLSKVLTLLDCKGMEQKMVPSDRKTSGFNRVPTNSTETISTGNCIVRVEWKDETCKDVRSCKWNRQAIGIKPSSCRGVFQSLPENNCIQYRNCKLSGGEEISPVGGLLLHPNERKCVCNHAHFRYWINILIQLFRSQIIRKLTVLGSLVTKHVAVDFVPNLCCCSNHATVMGQSISVIVNKYCTMFQIERCKGTKINLTISSINTSISFISIHIEGANPRKNTGYSDSNMTNVLEPSVGFCSIPRR